MEFIIHVNTLITNSENQILLVHEKKEKVFNKLNLPGGHLESGEKIIEGAKREVMEEVGVEVEMLDLIGIYTGVGTSHYINFIFAANIGNAVPVVNKNEINDLGWYSCDEILNMPDEKILNPRKLRKVISDYLSGNVGSLSMISEDI